MGQPESQKSDEGKAPSRWRAALGWHSLTAQATWAGLRIMIGYQAVLEGAGPALLAIMTAVFAIPALLAAIPAGRATDRWGGASMASGGSIFVCIGLLMAIFLPGLSWLLVASAVIGLGNLMCMVGEQSFIAHISEGRPTDGRFAFLSATASAGQAVGPIMVTVVAAGFSTAAFLPSSPAESAVFGTAPNTSAGLWVCFVVAALGIILYAPLRRAEKVWTPRAETKETNQLSSTPVAKVNLGLVWPALLVSGLVLVTLDMLYTFVPLWAIEQEINSIVVGILLSTRALVSMVSRFGLGALVRRFGRRSLLTVSTLLAAIGLMVMPFAGIPAAAIAMILIGVGLGIPQPLTMSWAVALTDARRHGTVLGWRLGTNRLAQILIPLGISAVIAPLGVSAIFYTNAALMAVASAVSLARGGEKTDKTSKNT